MEPEVEGQDSVGPATVQSAKDRVPKPPAAGERMRLGQTGDPRGQIPEPRHDLGPACSGMIEPADIPDVRLSTGFQLRD